MFKKKLNNNWLLGLVAIGFLLLALIASGSIYFIYKKKVKNLENSVSVLHERTIFLDKRRSYLEEELETLRGGKKTLYINQELGIEFIAASHCIDRVRVQEAKIAPNAQATLKLVLPQSQGFKESWITYDIFTQATYNVLPEKPQIALVLKNGNLVTAMLPEANPNPQDLPLDCVFEPRSL